MAAAHLLSQGILKLRADIGHNELDHLRAAQGRDLQGPALDWRSKRAEALANLLRCKHPNKENVMKAAGVNATVPGTVQWARGRR